MSRLGKKPIKIKDTAEVKQNGEILNFRGPKGELEYIIPRGVKAEISEGRIVLKSSCRKKEDRISFGLARATIANMLKGVTLGFKKNLILFGVGYTVNLEGENLVLSLGYSHPVKILKPKGIEVEIKKNEMEIWGIEKEKVGQFAAQIRDLKRVEPYKGKGFKYADEVVRRKVGKAALKAEGEAKA